MTESKFKFERKALARDWLNKLEPSMRSAMVANARTAGELCGLNWKQVQMLELKDFNQLMKEFSDYNELGNDAFLGQK